MTQQTINVGSGPDSYTGDTLRDAFIKVNSNFTELYSGNISANISGNVTVESITSSGNVTGQYFIGDGSQLTGITASGSNYGNSNVASYLPTYSGNVNAAYFIGNGALLTGITSNSSLGNLSITGPTKQTISGTIPAPVFIKPMPGNAVVILSEYDNTGITSNLVFSSDSAKTLNIRPERKPDNSYPNLSIASHQSFINFNGTEGNVNLYADNTLNINSNHAITFSSTSVTDGYNFIFSNGSLYSREFYAEANFPTGYQFNTPGGDTGLSHSYQNDVNGNVSVLRLRHDSGVPAKFYENNTSLLSGNLVVVQAGSAAGSFPDAFVQTYSTANTYTQFIWQNLDSNGAATGDIVITSDSGTDTSDYIDLGMTGSGYDNTNPNNSLGTSVSRSDGYLYVKGTNDGLSGNLTIGTVDAGTVTKIISGGVDAGNVVATFSETGVSVAGNISSVNTGLGMETRIGSEEIQAVYNNNLIYSLAKGPGGGSIYTEANKSFAIMANAGNSMWTFAVDGSLTYPDGTTMNGAIINAPTIQGQAYGGIYTISLETPFTNPLVVLDTTNTIPNGSQIVISGVTNPTEINGTWYAGFYDSTTIRLFSDSGMTITPDASGWAGYTGGGTIFAAPVLKDFAITTYDGNAVWYFGSDGNLSLPFSTSPGPIISGGIRFGDGSFQSTAANTNAIINGNTSISIPTAGGDITFQRLNSNYGHIGAGLAIGYIAGNLNQGTSAVALGTGAGTENQGTHAVAIGWNVGQYTQGNSAIAIGENPAFAAQGDYAIAIGTVAARSSQGQYAIAMGTAAGYSGQSANAVAIGTRAGQSTQGENAVAVGIFAGNTGQGNGAVAVGPEAGKTSQGVQGTALGIAAGSVSQGNGSVAVGSFAGQYNQKDFAIAIGSGAAANSQGYGAIAIGVESTTINQGDYSIAIGFTASNGNIQPNNSIIIDATNSQLAATGPGLFVSPVRSAEGANVSLSYNTSTKEITYSANTFVSNTYVPSTTSSAGTMGQITFDGNYVYICVGTNSWKRANLSTW